MSPRQQGDLGERSAACWLLEHGYAVFVPMGHSPDFDLIAYDGSGGGLLRVQVKTSTQERNQRWDVMLCTKGGNQSWNGTVKLFSASRCDMLFVLVADGRRWFIPASVIEGGTRARLGGPKYAKFEVEPGQPLHAEAAACSLSSLGAVGCPSG